MAEKRKRYYPGEEPTNGIKTLFHDNNDGTGYCILSDGTKVLVSAEDIPVLQQYYWRLSDRGYVETHIGPHGRARRKFMHRMIMGVENLDWRTTSIDHINMVKTDNRRENLRFCTNSQNQINRKERTDNTSGFTGVGKEGNRWYAYIGGRRLKGTCSTKEEAIQARKNAEIELFGDYSKYSDEDVVPVKATNGHEKRIYEYKGKMWTIKELEKTISISHKVILKYYRQGLTIDDIIMKVKNRIPRYEYLGSYLTTAEICKITGRDRSTICEHLRNGKTVEEIIMIVNKTNLSKQNKE